MSYSSVYSFEESVPEGMCQASILVTRTAENQRTSTVNSTTLQEPVQGAEEAAARENSSRSKYRTKSGGGGTIVVE